MAVALQSGVGPDEWLENPAALLTAAEILDEQAREAKRMAARRGR